MSLSVDSRHPIEYIFHILFILLLPVTRLNSFYFGARVNNAGVSFVCGHVLCSSRDALSVELLSHMHI